MNKKSLMGIALAAVVTLSSTSVIAIASQRTEKSTKNVVKVASNKVGTNVKDATTDTQNSNISSDKAVQITKKLFQDYFGVNIEKKIKKEGLKTKVSSLRNEIKVEFKDSNNEKLIAFAEISKIDGKPIQMSAQYKMGTDQQPYDKTKVKQAAESLLKKIGIYNDVDTDSIVYSDATNSAGVFTGTFVYKEKAKVVMQFSNKDYSPVFYSNTDSIVNEKPQKSDISDEKAEQIAKDAIKKYFAIDIDQEIKDYGLKIFLHRHNGEIFVDYNPASLSGNQDNGGITVAQNDGSVSSGSFFRGISLNGNQTYAYDENKLKEATQKFLKDNGFRIDVKALNIEDRKKTGSLLNVDCEYSDGSKMLLEFSAKDYSVVCFSGYGTFR